MQDKKKGTYGKLRKDRPRGGVGVLPPGPSPALLARPPLPPPSHVRARDRSAPRDRFGMLCRTTLPWTVQILVHVEVEPGFVFEGPGARKRPQ